MHRLFVRPSGSLRGLRIPPLTMAVAVGAGGSLSISASVSTLIAEAPYTAGSGPYDDGVEA